MSDSRTFKQGEVVILYSGGQSRSSVELAEIAEYVSYRDDTVLISFGAFNARASKKHVHKCPATLKKAIREDLL